LTALLAEPRYLEHFHHIEPLLEPLAERFGTVSLVLPAGAQASAFYRNHFAGLEAREWLEITTAPAPLVTLPVQPTPVQRERHSRDVARWLAQRIDELRPECVVIPTVDGLDSRLLRDLRGPARRETRFVFGYHWAVAPVVKSWRAWRVSPRGDPYENLWSARGNGHLVRLVQDHTILTELRKRRPKVADRIGPMPFAFRAYAPLSKQIARERIGLTAAGPVIGITGSLQRRKKIMEILCRGEDSGLLGHVIYALMGPFEDGLQQALAARFPDLVRRGRLWMRDRALSPQEVWTALSAFDCVVASYNPLKRGLSAIALQALAVGCPFIATATPWMRSVRSSTGQGHLVQNSADPAELARALLAAVASRPGVPPAVQALLDRHGVERYRVVMMDAVDGRLSRIERS
jgi:glycosyltransferase involved in cell wall biosynthesis